MLLVQASKFVEHRIIMFYYVTCKRLQWNLFKGYPWDCHNITDHFTVVDFISWPLSECEADLVLITNLLLM